MSEEYGRMYVWLDDIAGWIASPRPQPGAMEMIRKDASCVEVKEGYEVNAYKRTVTERRAGMVRADLSEALAIRTVEDVLRAFAESLRIACMDTERGHELLDWTLEAFGIEIDTPAPSRVFLAGGFGASNYMGETPYHEGALKDPHGGHMGNNVTAPTSSPEPSEYQHRVLNEAIKEIKGVPSHQQWLAYIEEYGLEFVSPILDAITDGILTPPAPARDLEAERVEYERMLSRHPKSMQDYCKGKFAPSRETQHPDDEAVDRFAVAMKAKLAKKRADGRGGWQDKDDCANEYLSQLLEEHVDKGDPVDVGNLAMMIHQRGEWIVSRETQRSPEPVAYSYRYRDPISKKYVWRSENGYWNGQLPTQVQPLYATPQPDELRQAKFEAWEAGFAACLSDMKNWEDNPYRRSTDEGES